MAKKSALTTAALTNAGVALSLYARLTAVGEKATQWHKTTYRKATEELYALLGECYGVTADVRNAGAAVVRELNKVLTNNSIPFNDGTALETKVVRVVFGDIGKRAHIYARVLSNARHQRVTTQNFTAWLDAQGGVEAVRRQHSGMSPAQVKAERVEKAEKSLPSVKEKQLSNAPKVDGSDYVLALVQHTNGKQRIVGFCDNLSVVKQVLARVADEAAKQADDITRADIERDARKYRQQIAQATAVTAKAA